MIQVTTELIKTTVSDILKSDDSAVNKLQNVCNLLKNSVSRYDWVGFYLVDPDSTSELILGPYTGAATEHTRIGFGEGICGQAASSLSVFIVDDVSLESNYLSCSPDVKSEFVAPVIREGILVGELDLDSSTVAAFGQSDIDLLNWIAEVSAVSVASAAGFKLAE